MARARSSAPRWPTPAFPAPTSASRAASSTARATSCPTRVVEIWQADMPGPLRPPCRRPAARLQLVPRLRPLPDRQRRRLRLRHRQAGLRARPRWNHAGTAHQCGHFLARPAEAPLHAYLLRRRLCQRRRPDPRPRPRRTAAARSSPSPTRPSPASSASTSASRAPTRPSSSTLEVPSPLLFAARGEREKCGIAATGWRGAPRPSAVAITRNTRVLSMRPWNSSEPGPMAVSTTSSAECTPCGCVKGRLPCMRVACGVQKTSLAIACLSFTSAGLKGPAEVGLARGAMVGKAGEHEREPPRHVDRRRDSRRRRPCG